MMAAFSLSWVFGVGAKAKGGRNRFPSWDDVLSCLELIREGKGSVTLELISKTAVGRSRYKYSLKAESISSLWGKTMGWTILFDLIGI